DDEQNRRDRGENRGEREGGCDDRVRPDTYRARHSDVFGGSAHLRTECRSVQEDVERRQERKRHYGDHDVEVLDRDRSEGERRASARGGCGSRWYEVRIHTSARRCSEAGC